MEKLQGPLPTPLSVYIIDEVCRGLEYAHQKKDFNTGASLNIVHRDISPPNIMISYEGAVKLIDFGIAKGRFQREETVMGSLKGKFAYMSPEQASGMEVDQRSDLFSVGLVLYELLTGAKIMAGETDFETIRNVMACHIPQARMLNPTLPAELDALLRKCLAKDPTARYSSATALRQDLYHILDGYRSQSPVQSLSNLLREVFKADKPCHTKDGDSPVIDRDAITKQIRN